MDTLAPPGSRRGPPRREAPPRSSGGGFPPACVQAGDRKATGSGRLPLMFELRRSAKALPVVAGVTIGILVLSQAGFLFPPPVVNPELEAQKPRTVPISQVPDRVLFEVNSIVS